MNTIDTEASKKIQAAIQSGKLKAGSWGYGNSTVCMMSALVTGARGTDDCVTAGWPKWLAGLNVSLFDAQVGAKDENAARSEFALRVAELVQTPRNYDKARDLFLIARLDTGEHSAIKSLRKNPVDAGWWKDCEKAIIDVVLLLHKRVAGEDVESEIEAAARRAARAASDAASEVAYEATLAADAAADAAARRAARAASYATNAADTAYAADAASSATYAASSATYATSSATYAAAKADYAAYAAARTDLINALEAS